MLFFFGSSSLLLLTVMALTHGHVIAMQAHTFLNAHMHIQGQRIQFGVPVRGEIDKLFVDSIFVGVILQTRGRKSIA